MQADSTAAAGPTNLATPRAGRTGGTDAAPTVHTAEVVKRASGSHASSADPARKTQNATTAPACPALGGWKHCGYQADQDGQGHDGQGQEDQRATAPFPPSA
ncbi:hypothetical protein ABZW03_31015 [Kitasatospora sp. NPDC004799]|uniref:hypothetical protein n=1 Tax=Kitasatospora sp. NPDC004799 TaxID=3154460 RepID=UPI0033A1EE81